MNKLYIGNLSPAVTADDLRQLFGDRKLPLTGPVLLKAGYAFVDYPDQNWAIRAIETLSGECPTDGSPPARARPRLLFPSFHLLVVFAPPRSARGSRRPEIRSLSPPGRPVDRRPAGSLREGVLSGPAPGCPAAQPPLPWP